MTMDDNDENDHDDDNDDNLDDIDDHIDNEDGIEIDDDNYIHGAFHLSYCSYLWDFR